MLRVHSPFMAAELDRQKARAADLRSAVIQLDATPEAFHTYLKFIHTGQVYVRRRNKDDSSDCSCFRLLSLYRPGRMLQDVNFRDAVFDIVFRTNCKVAAHSVRQRRIGVTYQNTTPAPPHRKRIIDGLLHSGGTARLFNYLKSDTAGWQAEFRDEILQALLASRCAGAVETVRPRERDGCYYHEHTLDGRVCYRNKFNPGKDS
jgi:hypothetical protein